MIVFNRVPFFFLVSAGPPMVRQNFGKKWPSLLFVFFFFHGPASLLTPSKFELEEQCFSKGSVSHRPAVAFSPQFTAGCIPDFPLKICTPFELPSIRCLSAFLSFESNTS